MARCRPEQLTETNPPSRAHQVIPRYSGRPQVANTLSDEKVNLLLTHHWLSLAMVSPHPQTQPAKPVQHRSTEK